jgi:hypothetical protein
MDKRGERLKMGNCVKNIQKLTLQYKLCYNKLNRITFCPRDISPSLGQYDKTTKGTLAMSNTIPEKISQCAFDFDAPELSVPQPQSDNVPQKQCKKCLQWKPVTPEFFHSHKGCLYGVKPVCKQCRSLRTTPLPEPAPEGHKRCGTCKTNKILDEFYKNRANRDGYHSSCKECARISDHAVTQRRLDKNEEHGEKQCVSCKQVKPFSEFQKDNGYHRNACKECRNKERSLRISIETEIPSEKWCSWCKQVKPIEEFGPNIRRKDKHHTYCRTCNNQRRQMNGLGQKRKKISREDYDKKLQEQNGLCAICHTHATRRNLHLDHDHKTGEIRDFLCSGCNTALGQLKEDPEIIKSMLQYIEKWKGGSV